MEIYLNSLDKVKKFVIIMSASEITEDVDLICGNHTIDAKSLLGILSLDLSRPMKVDFRDNDNHEAIAKKLYDLTLK